ncbi:hypothetical protein MtrunA17_Chr2g0282151 [Medicago truncatula]|uniref:Uncharacterized protein n=1 Tax=Medicago truncatula TaxID=3880 RepID=A0A396J1P2_MEDTR|nr:hypothetical protein MtrunA17_Chr2g0282151 [Medicago truncatula]
MTQQKGMRMDQNTPPHLRLIRKDHYTLLFIFFKNLEHSYSLITSRLHHHNRKSPPFSPSPTPLTYSHTPASSPQFSFFISAQHRNSGTATLYRSHLNYLFNG